MQFAGGNYRLLEAQQNCKGGILAKQLAIKQSRIMAKVFIIILGQKQSFLTIFLYWCFSEIVLYCFFPLS